MLSIKNSTISMSLSSLIFLLQLDLDGMSDQYALPNLFTTRCMQFLTLYASWMYMMFCQWCCKTVFFTINIKKLKGGGAPWYHPLGETLHVHCVYLYAY